MNTNICYSNIIRIPNYSLTSGDDGDDDGDENQPVVGGRL